MHAPRRGFPITELPREEAQCPAGLPANGVLAFQREPEYARFPSSFRPHGICLSACSKESGTSARGVTAERARGLGYDPHPDRCQRRGRRRSHGRAQRRHRLAGRETRFRRLRIPGGHRWVQEIAGPLHRGCGLDSSWFSDGLVAPVQRPPVRRRLAHSMLYRNGIGQRHGLRWP